MFKKMVLLSFIMVFFYTTGAFGTDITFTFANGGITGAYYEFDVMVEAGGAGTRIGDTQTYINYNTEAFGEDIASSITVTEGDLIDDTIGPFDLYLITTIKNNTKSRVSIMAEYQQEGNPDLGGEVPTGPPAQLLHVKIEIADPSKTAGLSFQESLMTGAQFQSDNDTIYSPVLAGNADNASLPVELSSFTAIDTAAGVELEWTTQTEVNNIGFYIYRSETKDGEYSRITKKMIEGAGSSAMPNTYSYIDYSVDSNVDTYFYYLEDVDIAGIKNKSQIIEMTRRKVSKFTAEYHKNSVSLKWSVEPWLTKPQLYIPAWNVYRSTNENGVYVKLDEPKFEFDDETHTYGFAESFSNEYLYRHPSEHLCYYVEGLDSEGRPFIKSRTVKVEIIPESFALFQSYPNPYNPETWIPYQLPMDTTVTIKIYSVTGRLVRTLSLGEKKPGMYISKDRAVHWDGRNKAGERVSSGLYFYAIEAGNFRGIKRMLLVK